VLPKFPSLVRRPQAVSNHAPKSCHGKSARLWLNQEGSKA